VNRSNLVFSSNKQVKRNPNQSSNVRKKVIQEENSSGKRSDKKHDIRVCVTPEQKKFIRHIKTRTAFETNVDVSMTQISSALIKDGLKREYNFPEVPYVNHDLIVHVKLDVRDYNALLKYCSLWDCSARRAAHRILCGMLIHRGFTHEKIQ
jgi:hypothetical protein